MGEDRSALLRVLLQSERHRRRQRTLLQCRVVPCLGSRISLHQELGRIPPWQPHCHHRRIGRPGRIAWGHLAGWNRPQCQPMPIAALISTPYRHGDGILNANGHEPLGQLADQPGNSDNRPLGEVDVTATSVRTRVLGHAIRADSRRLRPRIGFNVTHLVSIDPPADDAAKRSATSCRACCPKLAMRSMITPAVVGE